MELWYPGAVIRRGPSGKIYPNINTVSGIINHSAEGGYTAALAELDDESVDSNNRYTHTSWTFFIRKAGTVIQHYPITASPFHAGSKEWNISTVGVEHEGFANEPLTLSQAQASIEVNRWIALQGGFTLSRSGTGGSTSQQKTLWEHREVFATACPSGRIPWAMYETPVAGAPAVDNSFVGMTKTNDGAYEYTYEAALWHPNMNNAEGPYLGTETVYKGLVNGKHTWHYKFKVYPNWQG